MSTVWCVKWPDSTEWCAVVGGSSHPGQRGLQTTKCGSDSKHTGVVALDGIDVYRQTCFHRHDDGCACTGTVVEDLDGIWAPCPVCSRRHAWRECYPDRDVRPDGTWEAVGRHEAESHQARDAYQATRPREAP